jgi:hypothetical protein
VGGTILLAADRGELDPATAARLLSWVQEGGHLVVGVEHRLGHDPLLDMLGVSVQPDELRSPSPKLTTSPFQTERACASQLLLRLASTTMRDAASWSHESYGAIRMLQIPYENGVVTALDFPAVQQRHHRASRSRRAVVASDRRQW